MLPTPSLVYLCRIATATIIVTVVETAVLGASNPIGNLSFMLFQLGATLPMFGVRGIVKRWKSRTFVIAIDIFDLNLLSFHF